MTTIQFIDLHDRLIGAVIIVAIIASELGRVWRARIQRMRDLNLTHAAELHSLEQQNERLWKDRESALAQRNALALRCERLELGTRASDVLSRSGW